MAVREFAGDGVVQFSLGGLSGKTPGPWSVVYLLKLINNGSVAWPLLHVGTSSDTTSSNNFSAGRYFGYVVEATGSPSSTPAAQFNGSATTPAAGTVNFTPSDGWVLLCATKASGSAAGRYHIRKGGTTSRANGTSSVANGTTIAGTDRIFFGRSQFFQSANLRIATMAVFDKVLSDTDFDDLVTAFSTAGIYAKGPVTLWDFNQASTGTSISDLTGGGANQAALVNTSVVTGDDPAGWTFGVSRHTTFSITATASASATAHKSTTKAGSFSATTSTSSTDHKVGHVSFASSATAVVTGADHKVGHVALTVSAVPVFTATAHNPAGPGTPIVHYIRRRPMRGLVRPLTS